MTRLAVGFTQQVQMPWMERAAHLALAELPAAEAREELQVMLRPLVSVGGEDDHSNRSKVVGILMRTWITPPRDLAELHADALQMFAMVPREQRLALHWGLSAAVYPYFGTVVDAVGRLLTLQETTTLSQVARRVQEVYGQRESIERGTQRVLYTLHDWDVIRRTEHGVYVRAPRVTIENARLTQWLLETMLISKGAQSIAWSAAWRQPALFPFALEAVEFDIDGRLQVLRQGLDNDVIVR